MTIAGFYLTPEGVVLGADSTSSVPIQNGMHYFDFNQKVFEIGEDSTFGLLTWGLGGLGSVSYRTIVACLADELAINPAISVTDVAQRWIDRFWYEYSSYGLVQKVRHLHSKQVHDPETPQPNSEVRTADEETEYNNLKTALFVGFCIAGYASTDRKPEAAYVLFDPTGNKPAPALSTGEGWQWWGIPNIISRLVFGADQNLVQAILASNKWIGSPEDLDKILAGQALSHGSLPIRDAIDYVYSSIHCTIKAMKFSNMSQVCGGPIEIAVISSDRKFRWVRHKPWDAAITDGGL